MGDRWKNPTVGRHVGIRTDGWERDGVAWKLWCAGPFNRCKWRDAAGSSVLVRSSRFLFHAKRVACVVPVVSFLVFLSRLPQMSHPHPSGQRHPFPPLWQRDRTVSPSRNRLERNTGGPSRTLPADAPLSSSRWISGSECGCNCGWVHLIRGRCGPSSSTRSHLCANVDAFVRLLHGDGGRNGGDET